MNLSQGQFDVSKSQKSYMVNPCIMQNFGPKIVALSLDQISVFIISSKNQVL